MNEQTNIFRNDAVTNGLKLMWFTILKFRCDSPMSTRRRKNFKSGKILRFLIRRTKLISLFYVQTKKLRFCFQNSTVSNFKNLFFGG